MATPTATERKVPRRSLRVQAQDDPASTLSRAKKRKSGEGSSSSGMTLFNSFSYSRLTIEQIIRLFQVYQFQLLSSNRYDTQDIRLDLEDLGTLDNTPGTSQGLQIVPI